ncbi:MAG: FAD-dependent oxidoreductase, partial [Muribaculaceae bacterium]|nr:FAD-dependent oxidoreductase [Muribaculaceae bacterium]
KYETLHYDKLIIAAGTTNNFFNMPQLQKSVFTIKSTSEALRCRNEILDRLERASMAHDDEKRRKLLSFVVIGGGPTGVEIAGAIGEMKRYILQREYPSINLEDLQITIIEGSDRVLRTMSHEASENALKSLKELMVNVRLGVNVRGYENNIVTLADGTEIYSETVIWTAGVTGVPFSVKSSAEPTYERGHRFPTDEYCRVSWADDVFAIGDIALMKSDPDYPEGHPQLAQVAIQQSAVLAKNLNTGKFTRKFHYKDKGSMATIGRNRAVADLGRIHLSGYPAWVIWMFIHLISILGMRNKVTVLINWLWAYFTYGTSLRLLIHPDRYPLRSHWGEREP